YRLHVGTFPRPRVAFPAGGQAGKQVTVRLLGDVAGEISQPLRLPDQPTENYRIFADQNGQITPSPNVFRVSAFADMTESEPNNEPSTATAVTGEFPLGLNGIIAEKGDIDFFRLKAKKDQVLDINVYARRVRSPLDPVLTVCDAKGNGLASNDDTGGPDSYLRFTAPADGDYLIKVTDQLGAGGPQYVY